MEQATDQTASSPESALGGMEEENMSAITLEKSIAPTMLEKAIKFCAEKSGYNDTEKARQAIANGDCCVCEYLRYGLARQVAEYLGLVDETVTAIYVYEPEYATEPGAAGSGRPRAQPGMNLIARVSRKTAALSSVVASLSTAMDEELRRLGCPYANALCHELVVHLADEQEVTKRIGYGALVDSLYVRPIEVWHR
jgi:hypothetical protein